MLIRCIPVTEDKHATDIVRMGRAQHAEFLHTRMIDPKAAYINCLRFMKDPLRLWVNAWVLYDNDTPIGYFIGKVSQSFFSNQKYAVQDAWFVLKKYRGTRAGFKLLEAFERWADARGCEARYLTIENAYMPEHVERHARLMELLGYKVQGYIAVKQPTTAQEEVSNDPVAHRALGVEARA